MGEAAMFKVAGVGFKHIDICFLYLYLGNKLLYSFKCEDPVKWMHVLYLELVGNTD